MINRIIKAMLICVLSTSLMYAQQPHQSTHAAKKVSRYITGIAKIILGSLSCYMTTYRTSYVDKTTETKEKIRFSQALTRPTTFFLHLTPTLAGFCLVNLGIQDCINEYNNAEKQ